MTMNNKSSASEPQYPKKVSSTLQVKHVMKWLLAQAKAPPSPCPHPTPSHTTRVYSSMTINKP